MPESRARLSRLGTQTYALRSSARLVRARLVLLRRTESLEGRGCRATAAAIDSLLRDFSSPAAAITELSTFRRSAESG